MIYMIGRLNMSYRLTTVISYRMLLDVVYRQNRYSINLIKINCHLSLLQTTVKPVYTESCIERTLQVRMQELSII